MRRRLLALIGMALTLTLVAAACSSGSSGGGGGGKEESGTIQIGGQKANDHGTKDVSSASSLEVEVDSFYFDPTVIKGKAGEKVQLSFSNDSSTTHNFSVDSLGVSQDIQGEAKDIKVSVTLPKSGTLVFYCKFHKSSGMLGEFQVS